MNLLTNRLIAVFKFLILLCSDTNKMALWSSYCTLFRSILTTALCDKQGLFSLILQMIQMKFRAIKGLGLSEIDTTWQSQILNLTFWLQVWCPFYVQRAFQTNSFFSSESYLPHAGHTRMVEQAARISFILSSIHPSFVPSILLSSILCAKLTSQARSVDKLWGE